MDAKAFRGAAISALIGVLAIGLAACSEVEKLRIARVLDARDAAMSARDLSRYASLIADDYRDGLGRTKEKLLADLGALFRRFDRIEMHSMDRTVHLIDARHALVEQTYRLVVRQGEDARTIVQREQLHLVKTPMGWRIQSGL